MKNPYKAISYIIEAYKSSVEQLEDSLKGNEQYNKKRSQKAEKDREITELILSPRLTKQFMNMGEMGTYAPLNLSMSGLSVKDFQDIFRKYIADEETLQKYTDKLTSTLEKYYHPKRTIKFYDGQMYTDVVFQSFEELTDFIAFVYGSVKKMFKNQIPNELMNWKSFVQKIKKML